MMRRLSSIVAVFIMLVMMMPVLACASSPKMTRMEEDCCQQMHGRCGEMAKQGCCQVEVRNDPGQLPAHTVAVPLQHLVLVAILYPLLSEMPASAGQPWLFPQEHSPPGLLIAATTVLRI